MFGGEDPIGGMRINGVAEVAGDAGETALKIGAMTLGGTGATAVGQDFLPVVLLHDPVRVMGKEGVTGGACGRIFVPGGTDLVAFDTGLGVELDDPCPVSRGIGPIRRVRVGTGRRRALAG